MSRVNLERNIFDWPVNLNSFSTNENYDWSIKDIFQDYKMVTIIEGMLPEDISKMIDLLSKKKIVKELLIQKYTKKKEKYVVQSVIAKILKRMVNIKIDKHINAKNVIKNLMN